MSAPLVPIMVCKNEEIWIGRVLSALVSVFPHVVVADTGSTDSTREQIAKVPNVHLLSFENLSPADVGLCRGEIQKVAREQYGAERVFLVDADELYPIKYLRFIADNPMPVDAPGGFTAGVECTELPNGECWLYDVGCNRHAIFSADSKWSGVYPFESPDSYLPGNPKNHYWQSPDPSYRFFHLHQMRRSSKDEDVYMRMKKKYQFGLADHPEIKPTQFWLKSEKDYQDVEFR